MLHGMAACVFSFLGGMEHPCFGGHVFVLILRSPRQSSPKTMADTPHTELGVQDVGWGTEDRVWSIKSVIAQYRLKYCKR